MASTWKRGEWRGYRGTAVAGTRSGRVGGRVNGVNGQGYKQQRSTGSPP